MYKRQVGAFGACVQAQRGDAADLQPLRVEGVRARGHDHISGGDAVDIGQVIDVAGGAAVRIGDLAAHDAVVAGALHQAGHGAAGIDDGDDPVSYTHLDVYKRQAEHMGDRMIGWDVINEPIDDSTKGVRGINGVFGSEDADGNPDTCLLYTSRCV